MPKQVIVTVRWTCSLCQGETDEEKITPYKLNGAGATRAYDVCATCTASEPFATFLAAGLNERAADRTPTAPECHYCGKTLRNETGLAQHLARTHNVKSATRAKLELRGKTGDYPCSHCEFIATTVTGLASHVRTRHSTDSVPIEVPAGKQRSCPECEFVAANPQGLGAHRRSAHGVVSARYQAPLPGTEVAVRRRR